MFCFTKVANKPILFYAVLASFFIVNQHIESLSKQTFRHGLPKTQNLIGSSWTLIQDQPWCKNTAVLRLIDLSRTTEEHVSETFDGPMFSQNDFWPSKARAGERHLLLCDQHTAGLEYTHTHTRLMSSRTRRWSCLNINMDLVFVSSSATGSIRSIRVFPHLHTQRSPYRAVRQHL